MREGTHRGDTGHEVSEGKVMPTQHNTQGYRSAASEYENIYIHKNKKVLLELFLFTAGAGEPESRLVSNFFKRPFPYPRMKKQRRIILSGKNITSEKVEDITAVTVSASIMANLLSVTERRIRDLAQEEILVRVKHGRYDLAQSIKNYILHIKTNNDLRDVRVDEDIDLEKEKAMHERIKKETSELRLKVMRGELHYSEDVEKVMTDMLLVFRNKITNVGGKIAPMVIARTDLNDVEDIISDECMSALEELSEYDPALFYNDECIDVDDGIGDVIEN